MEKYLVVVGGINVDIGATPFQTPVPADSNPGRVVVSLGGVGRNIAHNLCLLGQKVYMLTALGTDANAEMAKADCARIGIDLSFARTVEGAQTSSYVFINTPDGELSAAVCDAAVAEEITPAYLADHLSLIQGAAAVVMDGNIPQASLEYLAEHARCPIFADPVSVVKGEKLRTSLSRVYLMKPNLHEASTLSGLALADNSVVPAAARALLERGVQNVVISLGKDGAYALSDSEECLLPAFPDEALDAKNTSGAGDAMMAALVYASLLGLSLRERLELALCASALAIESEAAINEKLSPETLLDKREEYRKWITKSI